MPKAKKQWKKAAPDALENFVKKSQLHLVDLQKKPDSELFTTEVDLQEAKKIALTLRQKKALREKKLAQR